MSAGGAMPVRRKSEPKALDPDAGSDRQTQSRSVSRHVGKLPVADPARPGGSTVAFPGLDFSPVFVHSSFRSSSTWLWSKLRATPHTAAYYEIFNEGLAHIDVRVAVGLNQEGWASGHPPGAPYFLEFLPLLQQAGGIEGFHESMGLVSFIPAAGLEGELTAAERIYVDRLITNARANWKIPVLCDTRTLGRARAMRSAFGGRTVFCHRNLFHQWASYAGQAMAGNPYFLHTIDTTLKASRHDPFLAVVDDWTAGRTICPTDTSLFQAFLLLHLYLSAQVYDDTDLIVDVSAIASSPSLRHRVEGELSRLVSAPVDLSDVHVAFDMSPVEVRSPADFVDTINQFTKMIRGTCRSAQAAAFVETLKDAALSEWERHEFFIRKSRRIQSAILAEAQQQAREAAGLAAGAAEARDVLAQQQAADQAAAAALQQALHALEGERNLLRDQCAADAAMIAALQAAEATLTADREAQAHRAHAAEAERDAHWQQAAAAEAERDAQTRRALAAEADREAQARRAQMAEMERDAQARRAEEAEAERMAQSQRAEEARAEHDRLSGVLALAKADAADLRGALAAKVEERDALAAQLAALPSPGSRANSWTRLRKFMG